MLIDLETLYKEGASTNVRKEKIDGKWHLVSKIIKEESEFH